LRPSAWRRTSVRGDEAHIERDLLRAGHLQVLPLLDRLDEGRGLQESLVGAGVEPGHPAAELLDVQLAAREGLSLAAISSTRLS
jgi:hypothetical protein